MQLAIFYATCRKKHPRGECSLNNVVICAICTDNHPMDNCPSLLGLKAVYEGNEGTTKQLCTLATKKPWQPRPPGMDFDPFFSNSAFMNGQHNTQWYPTTSWEDWPQQTTQNHP